jgi:hypothetical protein
VKLCTCLRQAGHGAGANKPHGLVLILTYNKMSLKAMLKAKSHVVNDSYTHQCADLRSAPTTETILILLVLGTAETPFNARQETTETQSLKDGNIFLKHKTTKTNRRTNLERVRITLWWRAIAHIWIIHRAAVLMSSLTTLGFNPTPLDRSICPSSGRHGE